MKTSNENELFDLSNPKTIKMLRKAMRKPFKTKKIKKLPKETFNLFFGILTVACIILLGYSLAILTLVLVGF